MKPILIIFLLLLVTASAFGANPDYKSFRGINGITIVSNPPNGTIVFDGSGISSPTGGVSAATVTNIVLANGTKVAAGNNATVVTNTTASNIVYTVGVKSNLLFNAAGSTYMIGSDANGNFGISNVASGRWSMVLSNGAGDDWYMPGFFSINDIRLRSPPGSGDYLSISSDGLVLRTNGTGGGGSPGGGTYSVQMNTNGTFFGDSLFQYIPYNVATEQGGFFGLAVGGASTLTNGITGNGFGAIGPHGIAILTSNQTARWNYTISGNHVPQVSNAVDQGSFLLPVRTNWVNNIVVKDGIDGNGYRLTNLNNGIAIADEYGADPTGVADSTAAIQAAIDTGKMAWLTPTGSYKLTASLVLDTQETLLGNNAVITATTNNQVVVKMRGAHNRLEGLRIRKLAGLTNVTAIKIEPGGPGNGADAAWNVVRDMDIRGVDPTDNIGTAIWFYANNGADNDANDIHNIVAYYMDIGVLFASTPLDSGLYVPNRNYLSDIWLFYGKTAVVFSNGNANKITGLRIDTFNNGVFLGGAALHLVGDNSIDITSAIGIATNQVKITGTGQLNRIGLFQGIDYAKCSDTDPTTVYDTPYGLTSASFTSVAIPSRNSDPATGAVGQMFWNSSIQEMRFCNAVNTWVPYIRAVVPGGSLIKQTADNSLGGLAIGNVAGSASGRLWMDSAGTFRMGGNYLDASPVVLNGSGAGQVGIGTNATSAKLHVRPSTAGSPYFRIDETNGTKRVQMGVYPGSEAYACLWLGDVTASSLNYNLAGDGNEVYLNAGGTSGTINFSQGGSGALRWKIAGTTGHLLAGIDNTYDIGAAGATRPRNVYVAGTVTAGSINATTNSAAVSVTTNLFAAGTRYTNSNRRAFVTASIQLSAAAAGTAKMSLYVENAGSATNKVSCSAGPLASLITVEQLILPVGPSMIYYFTDETSGAGASVAIVADTCSITGW